MSIIILLGISTASLGQDTKDTTINLPKTVAKEVVKDLIRLDSISSENKILKQNFDLLSQISGLKDIIIKNKDQIVDLYKQKEGNYNSMLGDKAKQLSNSEELNKSLSKDLKNAKAGKTFWQIFSIAVATFLGYLYATK
jgi:hypothetical protein